MRRREFITLFGGAAVAWPLLCVRSSPNDVSVRLRHDRRRTGRASPPRGIPGHSAATGLDRRPQRADRYSLARERAEQRSQIRSRAGSAGTGRYPGPASASVAALQQVSNSVPIVFTNVIDPVGAGFVLSDPGPGGNITGFSAFEYSLSGKMARTAQTDCAKRDPSCSASRSRISRRDRPIRSDPGPGAAVIRRGINTD